MGIFSYIKDLWKKFTVYESPKYVLVRDPILVYL